MFFKGFVWAVFVDGTFTDGLFSGLEKLVGSGVGRTLTCGSSSLEVAAIALEAVCGGNVEEGVAVLVEVDSIAVVGNETGSESGASVETGADVADSTETASGIATDTVGVIEGV